MTERADLSELRARYDALYCDVWGVIRDGRALLPEAVEALRTFRRTGGAVCLVSNSPQPNAALISALDRLGLPGDAVDAVVTSGDAIHAELAARAPGRAFPIGPGSDHRLYEGLDVRFTDIRSADFVSCTGPDDYWHGKPEDYREVLQIALDRDLDLVCANPDIVVQAGDRLVYCAGAIARLYREMGGRSIVAGKPHRPIYALAGAALDNVGKAAPIERTLAVGDGPETDIAGAMRAGIDAFFIAGGILAEESAGEGDFDLAAVERALASYGVSARWAAPRLIW